MERQQHGLLAAGDATRRVDLSGERKGRQAHDRGCEAQVKFCFPMLLAVSLAAAPAPNKIPRGADGKPDLGGEGVWFPLRVEDITNADYKVDVPFLPWAKTKFEDN